jgi:hypothetical protein
MAPRAKQATNIASPYSTPTATLHESGKPRTRRFRLLAIPAGLLAALATFLVFGAVLLENMTAFRAAFGGLELAVIASFVIVPPVVAGIVAAKLGRPRYGLHSAGVGGFLALLLYGAGTLVSGPPDLLEMLVGTALLVLSSWLGGWFVRWQERIR